MNRENKRIIFRAEETLFFGCRMLTRRTTVTLVCFLGICFLGTGLSFGGIAQTAETPAPLPEKGKIGKGIPEESVITVKAEDIEHAVIKQEEVKLQVHKAIDEIKSLVASLEQEAQAMIISRDRLIQEKMAYQGRKGNQKYLEVLDKEIEAIQEKTDLDNELIETYEDRITVLEDQSKVYADQVVLLTSIFMLDEIISTTPSHAAPEILKEMDLVQNNITEIQDGLKEKSSVVSFFTRRLKEVAEKALVDSEKLDRDLKSETESRGNSEPEKIFLEKQKHIVKLKKAGNEQRITLFQTRLETSKIRYDAGLQAWKNAEIHVAFLTEKVRLLETKQKEGK